MRPDAPTRAPVADLAVPPAIADAFPPDRTAALEHVASVDPATYARTRNHLRGAVTRLSPYLTHGLVSVPEVLAAVGPNAGKLAQELGWREYFHLVHEREGAAILRDRFGPEVAIEFLYTLRDRDSWLASVHGHLLRSINLRTDLADFRAGFRRLPDPASDVQRIAAALAPIPVHIAWLEDYADLPEGPAGAVLDLIGFPMEMLDTLKPAPHGNPGQPDDLREKFRALNRGGSRGRELKAAKEALLAASRQKP